MREEKTTQCWYGLADKVLKDRPSGTLAIVSSMAWELNGQSHQIMDYILGFLKFNKILSPGPLMVSTFFTFVVLEITESFLTAPMELYVSAYFTEHRECSHEIK